MSLSFRYWFIFCPRDSIFSRFLGDIGVFYAWNQNQSPIFLSHISFLSLVLLKLKKLREVLLIGLRRLGFSRKIRTNLASNYSIYNILLSSWNLNKIYVIEQSLYTRGQTGFRSKRWFILILVFGLSIVLQFSFHSKKFDKINNSS